MKCIILAAGYATRLYPLTKNTAKPLLEVAGKPILKHILEKVERIDVIDDIFIVTNDKFYPDFVNWIYNNPSETEGTVIYDETTTNDNRLGAIADIQYAIRIENLAEDVPVSAGDHVFDFELKNLVDF